MDAITEINHRFAERVRRIRAVRGMSQTDLAAAVHSLDRTAIGKIETGDRRASVGEAFKIANALEVPLGEMLGMGPMTITVETSIF